MVSTHLIEKVKQVPSNYEKELEDFIDTILHKTPENSDLPKRQLGLLRGKLTMAPDFDEPLEYLNGNEL